MGAPQHEGRLELTWTNKHRRLLSHGDGSYEWTEQGDHRVAEVRLLHDVATVGNTRGPRDRAKDNLLIRGDALHALTSLTKLPEFRDEYVGRVKLCYIDPPFNTGQAFTQYDDALEHSVWLTAFRDRVEQIAELLAPDGSVWVHLDDAEVHRARCVMDDVFGTSAFVATVVWQKRPSKSSDEAISGSHDYLLVYAPQGSAWRHTRNLLPLDDKQRARYSNPDDDPRGPWLPEPMDAPNLRPNLTYAITTPTGAVKWPPAGRCWRTTEEKYEELLADNRIYFGKKGDASPKVKAFLSDSKGIVPGTWWPFDEVGSNAEAKKESQALFPERAPFDTPKPERLMHRIIHLASNPGDVVLDCYAGSGTTAATAHKMGRRWVTVERAHDNVEHYALPRLTQVVEGGDDRGVTTAVGWTGGGSFRVLDVAPSMFSIIEGRVVLAGWAVNSALAEAVAAQVGFAYSPDPPFTGVKGRTHLAVVDGLVDDAVVTMLAGWLPDGELLTVYGTAVDPASKETLRSIRRGCTVRKIPQSVLDEYRRRGRSDGLNWPSEAATSGAAAAPITAGALAT